MSKSVWIKLVEAYYPSLPIMHVEVAKQADAVLFARLMRAYRGGALRCPHHTCAPGVMEQEAEKAQRGVLFLEPVTAYRASAIVELGRLQHDALFTSAPIIVTADYHCACGESTAACDCTEEIKRRWAERLADHLELLSGGRTFFTVHLKSPSAAEHLEIEEAINDRA